MPYQPLTSPGYTPPPPINWDFLRQLLYSLGDGGHYQPLTPGPEITPAGLGREIPSTLGPGYRQPIPAPGSNPALGDILRSFGPGGTRGPASAIEPRIGEMGAAPIASPFPPGFELPPLQPPSYIPPMMPNLNGGGGGMLNNPPVPQMPGDPLQYTPEVSPFPPGFELPPLKPPTQFGTTGGPPLTSNPEESQAALGQGMDWLTQMMLDPNAMPESIPQSLANMLLGQQQEAAAKATGQPVHAVDPTVPTGQDAPVLGGDVYNQPGQPAPGKPGGPISIPADLEPPAPVHYPAPPQIPSPVAPDYSAMENYLKQATPQGLPPEMLQRLQALSVIQGLAGGAAEVDPSSPGAWSRVLASAGAGGMAGAVSGEKTKLLDLEHMRQLNAEHAVRMANFEGDKAKGVADHANAVAETAYNNKINEYKTNIQNAESERGYSKELKELYKPDVVSTANGLVSKIYNPVTKAVEIQTYDTEKLWNDASKIDDITKSFGPGSAVTQNAKANVILSTIDKLPPQMKEPVLRKEMIHQIVDAGQGKAIFKQSFDKAFAEASRVYQVQMAQNPDKTAPLVAAMTADILFNDSDLAGSAAVWGKDAANAGVPLAKAYVKAH